MAEPQANVSDFRRADRESMAVYTGYKNYSPDYIGLLSNENYSNVLNAGNMPDYQSFIKDKRGQWFNEQKSLYGEGGSAHEAALRQMLNYGGGKTYRTPIPGYSDENIPGDIRLNPNQMSSWFGRNDTSDTKELIGKFNELQYAKGSMNLDFYDGLVKMAVGLVGKMDGNGKITGDTSGIYGGDPAYSVAFTLLQYNYDSGESTRSAQQQGLVENARKSIGEWGGQFANPFERFDQYQGASLQDTGRTPEQLGRMANRYNNFVQECYTRIYTILRGGGVAIEENPPAGLDYNTLMDSINQLARGGVSREELAEARQLAADWRQYKQAVDIIDQIKGGLYGIDQAKFILAYCGKMRSDGTPLGEGSEKEIEEGWPWWEERSAIDDACVKAEATYNQFMQVENIRNAMTRNGVIQAVPDNGESMQDAQSNVPPGNRAPGRQMGPSSPAMSDTGENTDWGV